eukprot:g3124.t1
MRAASSSSRGPPRFVERCGRSSQGLGYRLLYPRDYLLLEQSAGAHRQRLVVYLHGWLQNHHCWLTTARRIAAKYNLPGLLIDFPGHGESAPVLDTDDFPPAQWVNRVHELLVELGHVGVPGAELYSGIAARTAIENTSRLTLAGVSMGGRIAMEFFHRFGATGQIPIDRLIIIGTCGHRQNGYVPFYVRPARKLAEHFWRKFEQRVAARKHASAGLSSKLKMRDLDYQSTTTADSKTTNMLGILSVPRHYPDYHLPFEAVVESMKKCDHVAFLHGRLDYIHFARFNDWAGGRRFAFFKEVGLFLSSTRRATSSKTSRALSGSDDGGGAATATNARKVPAGLVSAIEFKWRIHETTCPFVASMHLEQYPWFWKTDEELASDGQRQQIGRPILARL